MKNMNMKKRYWIMNLQVFAGDGEGDDPGDESGDDDDDPGDDDDDSDDDDKEENEKKFSQKDVNDAVKKRLAREKRKWQRDQQKKAGKAPDGKGKAGDDGEEDDEETKELREKAAKAEEMELKWTCLEHDVDKSCVDDVLALAKVHMAKDEDLDIEDAIDKVLEKYPSFKTSSKKEDDEDEGEENTKKKSWGQRQSGRRQKVSGVEAAFLKRNPGLKID